MSLRTDCSAMESIPLRLMIIAVVAALSIVPAAEALETLKTRDFVRRATLEVERVIAAAQIVGVEGPGSVRTVSLDFGGGGSARFKCLDIGDGAGGTNVSAAVLSLTTGARIFRSASDPPVCLRSAQGGVVHVSTPVVKLRLSCELADSTSFVLVELV